MKKLLSILAFSGIILTMITSGCAPTQKIAEKSGAQLWGENCNRCHNSPSKDQYSPEQWDVIVTHMKVRANVTDDEVKKIEGFLQGTSM